MIVIDASAAVELLLHTGKGERAAARIADPMCALYAPHVIDLEVAHAARGLMRGGLLTRERGALLLADLRALDLERCAHDVLLPRIWALAGHLTAYDAAYVALSEALDAPLLTADARLARSEGHRARIELV
jgi:predicted nucleic acid-binding protein